MKKEIIEEESVVQTKKKSSDTFEIKIPRLMFKDTKINIFLVFTLVIFAFLLGMLTNKVIYLEQQVRISPTPAPQQVENTAPTPHPVVADMTTGNLPTLGSKQAKVIVVEFGDFQCTFCKKYFDETHKQILEKYVDTGKIQFAYRHFPLSSIHPLAQRAGEASECANDQGKFWEYHDLLFDKQAAWATLSLETANASFTKYAGELGLTTEQFNTCLSSEKYKKNVDADTAIGTNTQVSGTPTFFVNGVRIVGAVPFAELQKVIEEELKK